MVGFFSVETFFSYRIDRELFNEGFSFYFESNILDNLVLDQFLLVDLLASFTASGFGKFSGNRVLYKF